MDDRDRWVQFFAAIMTAEVGRGYSDAMLKTLSAKIAPIADKMLEEYHKRFVKDTNFPYRTQ